MEQQAIRDFLISYGNSVRNARIKANMTQVELSQLIPCSQAIISHIEQGYMLPPPHILKAIHEILGV